MKFEDACNALPGSSVVGGQLIAAHKGKPIVVGTHLNGQLLPDTSVEALELIETIASAKAASFADAVDGIVAEGAAPQTRRKRRTKAEIAADRLAAEEAGEPQPEDEPEDGDDAEEAPED